MACNGMLAGLVAITAPCAFVSPNSAIVIGILAGILVCVGVLFNERVIKVEIRAAPSPCTATAAGWAQSAVGIFADGTYGAGWNGVGATSYLGKAGQGVTGPASRRRDPVLPAARRRHDDLSVLVPLYVHRLQAREQGQAYARIEEVEQEGLDVPEFGMTAYPDGDSMAA